LQGRTEIVLVLVVIVVVLVLLVVVGSLHGGAAMMCVREREKEGCLYCCLLTIQSTSLDTVAYGSSNNDDAMPATILELAVGGLPFYRYSNRQTV
jgi:hypothetical protein